MRRRDFLHQSLVTTTGGILLSNMPSWIDSAAPEVKQLTILHTNDVHSRIEPFPMDGTRNQGRGGAARRAKVIDGIRDQSQNVLLLDSGDMFQGTPYFNFFSGEIEIKLMSSMKYDAATIGNHDFDNGIQNLADQLAHANFPILIANYDLRNTPLAEKHKAYKIFNKGGIKIGVFGLGIEFNGLVPRKLHGDAVYLDPISVAHKTADILRQDEKCDFVICLSHLGYDYPNENKVSDKVIAIETTGIDLILGGHTHTFMDKPEAIVNKGQKTTYIHQVGWGGMVLGRIDITFEKNKKERCITCSNTLI
jgi:5'-nucleotidase